MVPLSSRTHEHIDALFEADERPEAARLLLSLADLGQSSERIRFAALRVSGGTVAGLRDALERARKDWRDLLLAADFGTEHAHIQWRPRRFSHAERHAWHAGAIVEGVSFPAGARVRIDDGRHLPSVGVVVELLGVEPHVRYRVRTDAGSERDVWQHWLDAG